MKNIKDYNLEELKEELKLLGEKPFRAEQIFKWLFQDKVKSFDEMTNLSLSLREKLKSEYDICNFEIVKKLESVDGTKKYLFGMSDGNAIESVLMEYHFGKTVCVSSQIGCKMGCKFCASTGIPFIRSLTSGEIVEQIISNRTRYRSQKFPMLYSWELESQWTIMMNVCKCNKNI